MTTSTKLDPQYPLDALALGMGFTTVAQITPTIRAQLAIAYATQRLAVAQEQWNLIAGTREANDASGLEAIADAVKATLPAAKA